jgi:hypothetical protein
MDIKRIGSQPSGRGPPDWFTGTVRIDPLFKASDPARVAGASVTFEPGARTAWHTHPLGQRRCRLVSTGREALARRDADDRDNSHRDSGIAERQGRRVDGEGQRRAISQMSRDRGENHGIPSTMKDRPFVNLRRAAVSSFMLAL